MKKVNKTSCCFFSFLDFIFSQENVSQSYKASVKKAFVGFLLYCKKFHKSIFMKRDFNLNKHFYIKRFSYRALNHYIKAINYKITTKRRLFYILKKYISFFNRKPYSGLTFKKLSAFIPKKKAVDKKAFILFNFFKSHELNEDLLVFYFMEYLGLSLYSISKLRVNEVKYCAGKIKVCFYYNKKQINKVLAPEIYELIKDQLTIALEKRNKWLIYSNISETKAKTRKARIEKKLINLLKKAGIKNSGIKELIKKYRLERPAKALSKNEREVLKSGIEVGNGLIDSELSLFIE